jgi:hypothetical protein
MRTAPVALVCLIIGTTIMMTDPVTALASGASSAAPVLHITKGPYHNGQLINISVGPNHLFKPYLHVNILECANPGGKKAKLPVNANTCDGNTIQGNTVLVAKDGSFSETGYQLFALPNVKSLGEEPSGQPVCNRRAMCVLYIGENQENFTWPKMFSAAFTISPAKGK